MKYNWNSTRKTKKKNFLGFILQDITHWNHKNVRNCYFWWYSGGLGPNVEFNGFLWFCEFLKVSASIFWLKTVLTLNYVFLLILNIFQGESSEKTFYVQINRWYWCKKDQKNFPQTSHKFFSQCLIVNSSLLWAFMFQSVCQNSFSGGRSRKKWHSCNKNYLFFARNPPELQVSMS